MNMIKDAKEKVSQRLKKNYALARSLGFSSYEATRLAQRSEKNIIKYAVEQGKVIDADTPIDVTLETP